MIRNNEKLSNDWGVLKSDFLTIPFSEYKDTKVYLFDNQFIRFYSVIYDNP